MIVKELTIVEGACNVGRVPCGCWGWDIDAQYCPKHDWCGACDMSQDNRVSDTCPNHAANFAQNR